MNGKKAQIVGQIFIYMMAVIIIGGIMLIGYSAVKKIIVKGCEAEKVNFKADIEDMIERYNSYGAVNKQAIKAPCEYDVICFVDAARIEIGAPPIRCSNSLINDSVKNHVQQNIFVISNRRTIPIGYSNLVSLNSTDAGGCLCIAQRSSNFNIIFNGRGSSTEIRSG
jgi:hypothetical protein